MDPQAGKISPPAGHPKRLRPVLCVWGGRKEVVAPQFMELVGNALVEFSDDEWPSMTEGIPCAPDLPVEERYDMYRTGLPHRQQAARPQPAHSSSDEEDIDDPAPADDWPPELDVPAAPDVAADAPAAPDVAADNPAVAAGTPADPPVPDPPGDMPAPAHGASPR